MAGITALTNIGEGAAQVFDTTSLIQQQKAEQTAKEDKIIESQLDYDPNDVWSRDIDHISSKLDGYQKWMTDNYDRLNASGKDRMQAWTEKKQLENGIRNEIAASKQAGTIAKQMSTAIMTDPDFNTKANRERAAAFSSPQRPEAYENKEAYNGFAIQQQMLKEVNIPLEDIIKNVEENLLSSGEMRTYGMKSLTDKRTMSPENKILFDAKMKELYENGNEKTSAEKIQGKYASPEELGKAVLGKVDYSVKTTFVNAQTGEVKAADNKKFAAFGNESRGFGIGVTADEITGGQGTANMPGRLWGTNKTVIKPEDITTDETGAQYTLDKQGNKVPITREDLVNAAQASYYDPSVIGGISFGGNDKITVQAPGVVGGVNMIDGSYSSDLFETSANITISDIVIAEKAIAPVYAKYMGMDSEGNAKEYKREIKTNEMIPSGATLFTDKNYSTLIDGENEYQYKEQDLYAAVQGQAPRVKANLGSEYQMGQQIQGGSSFAKGLVPFDRVSGYISNVLPHYPGLAEKISELQNSKTGQSIMTESQRIAARRDAAKIAAKNK